MKKTTLVLAALLSGCGTMADVGNWFDRERAVDVAEVRRAVVCGTSGADARVSLFPDAGAVRAWETSRGVQLGGGTEALPDTPFALVEMGERNTAGYGLAVSRTAGKRGDAIILRATFLAPTAGRMLAQMVTSPCVLVSLPKTHYSAVELVDQDGRQRATTERP